MNVSKEQREAIAANSQRVRLVFQRIMQAEIVSAALKTL